MKTFKEIREHLASGRPLKKPVSSTLLKNIAKDNEVKELKSIKMKEEKGRGPTGIAYTVSQGHPDAEDPKTRKKYPERQSTEYKSKFNKDKPGLKQYTEEKAGDTCSCCDSKIDDKGSCGCDSSCKHCGGSHNITELKTQTLSNYIRKSVSPLSKKSVGNLASKGAHKLAHSDDFDAGEKEDMKSVQRAKGVIRATKKIAKRAQANESSRDNYNPEISDKRTKEKLKKAGLPSESPKVNGEPGEKVMEAKKPIVHSTKKDSLKMIKIKYNSPIKTKVTDIGAGGKEYVRKDWSEGYNAKDMKADEKEPDTLPKLSPEKQMAAMRANRQSPKKQPAHGVFAKHGRGAATGIKEASSKEIFKKRMASKHPDDNPQATKRIDDDKGGMKTYKLHPGAKFQKGTGDVSQKGKTAAIKKQHERRPEEYGIKEAQRQLVTNLNQQEGVGAMVRRGLDKVRDTIKTAENDTGLKVDASKNKIGKNPLKDSQKKN